jgi:hypothetical protein
LALSAGFALSDFPPLSLEVAGVAGDALPPVSEPPPESLFELSPDAAGLCEA